MQSQKNAKKPARLEHQLLVTVASIAPQFRHLVLEIAQQMAERHPNVPPQPLLRLVPR